MSLSNNFPTIAPSLNLDFANVKALDPRITFTRTTTATYYDGKTTAKAEENLLLQSQDFTTTWANTGTTDTANTDIAPDGTTTADTLTALNDASSGNTRIEQTGVSFNSGQNYVFSVFVKNGTIDYLQLFFATATHGANAYANFDLTGAGALGTVGSAATATITASTNGFFRLTISAPCTSSASSVVFVQMIASTTDARAASITRSGQTVILWGAQLEQRSAVTAYTPTTTQPITNYIPVLLTAASGVARFDHNPTTGESLGLLVEEQRTNLATYSSEFDNAAWTKTRSSITSNTIVAPDGTLTGDKLIEDTTASNTHYVQRTETVVNATIYTLSCYVKASERSIVNLTSFQSTSPFTTHANAFFDLATQTVTSGTGTIVPVGNGWYRLATTFTASSTGETVRIQLVQSGTTTSYTGDGYSGIYLWGAQLEAGAFPTSYIPTVAATVTRNADAASMTGTNFSSWYRADEGTVFAELQTTDFGVSGNPSLYSINTDANNRIFMFVPVTAQNYRTQITTSGSSELLQNIVFSTNIKDANKTVVAYKTNNSVSYGRNTNSDDTSCLIPVVDKLEFGSSTGLTKYVRKLSFYPARLSNAQLQALTTV